MSSGGQEQILYALVAHGSKILAEYTERSGNFERVTKQLLPKININENKIMSYVYPKEKYVFHYIVENNITYLCMADEGFGRMIPFRFLEDMKNKFKSSFGDRAKTAHAYAFNADFQGTIRRLTVCIYYIYYIYFILFIIPILTLKYQKNQRK